MGKQYPKMQCSMMIAALSIFSTKSKIALTGSQSSNTFNSVLFTETYLFPCKKCFPTIQKINQQNYETFATPGPGCSKLTTSLVKCFVKISNVNISNMPIFFLSKKCEQLLYCKNFSHFFNKKFQCIWL